MVKNKKKVQRADEVVRHPDLSMVVPCYNEEEVLGLTARALAEEFDRRGVELELVLVDNGSSDGTAEVIDAVSEEGLPVVKVSVSVNRGYGHGALAGIQVARGRYVGTIPADGEVEPRDVARLYEVVSRSPEPRLAKVRRRFRMDGLKRKLVSISYNGLTNLLFGGLGSIDINGNPKILPRSCLEAMDLRSEDWFLDAEVMIKAKRMGLEVFEKNVFAQMRAGGTSNVRPATCWEFFRNLARARLGLMEGWDELPATPPPVGEARGAAAPSSDSRASERARRAVAAE